MVYGNKELNNKKYVCNNQCLLKKNLIKHFFVKYSYRCTVCVIIY